MLLVSNTPLDCHLPPNAPKAVTDHLQVIPLNWGDAIGSTKTEHLRLFRFEGAPEQFTAPAKAIRSEINTRRATAVIRDDKLSFAIARVAIEFQIQSGGVAYKEVVLVSIPADFDAWGVRIGDGRNVRERSHGSCKDCGFYGSEFHGLPYLIEVENACACAKGGAGLPALRVVTTVYGCVSRRIGKRVGNHVHDFHAHKLLPMRCLNQRANPQV